MPIYARHPNTQFNLIARDRYNI